ncbi:MAG: hypothetical protein ACTSRZ_11580 [Promethearchaeota archaeon]
MARHQYNKGEVEKFFRKLVENLNKISENPLDTKNDIRIRVPFFPLQWDLSQFYFISKEFYKIKLFADMVFIITNKDYSEAQEIFILKFNPTDEEEIITAQQRFNFEIISIEIDQYPNEMEMINKYLKEFDVKIFKFMQNFLKNTIDFDIGQLFILREGIANVGILEETDYINSDVIRYLKDFFALMRKGLKEHVLKKIPVIEYSTKELRSNPIVKFFIKFGQEWASVEINRIMDLLAMFFDGTSYNILILNDNEIPLCICRMTVADGVMHFNPVPIQFVKNAFEDKSECKIDKILKKLYTQTKVKSVGFKLNELIDILYKLNSKSYSFIEFVLDIIQFVAEQKIYPESIISTIFSEMLNIKFQKGVPYIKEVFNRFVSYYSKILVGTLVTTKEGWKDLDTLCCIQINRENQLEYIQIPTEKYIDIFNQPKKTPELVEIFIDKLEKDSNTEYPLTLFIKIDELINIFSLKNLYSLVEMQMFMESLPSLEKISEMLMQISQSQQSDKLKQESKSKEEIIENEKEKEKMEKTKIITEIPSLDHFLTKGIIVKVKKEPLIISNKSGYLGLDLQKIKEFIEKTFPQILND